MNPLWETIATWESEYIHKNNFFSQLDTCRDWLEKSKTANQASLIYDAKSREKNMKTTTYLTGTAGRFVAGFALWMQIIGVWLKTEAYNKGR